MLRVIDQIGTRRGYAWAVILWSVAAAGHALAASVTGFGVARFALGLGEAGNFPAAIKAVAEWFPRRERALAHASLYLDTFGHTVIAWMWLRQAVAASVDAHGEDARFYRGKLAAAHHFFHCELPTALASHAVLRSLDPALVELDDAWL